MILCAHKNRKPDDRPLCVRVRVYGYIRRRVFMNGQLARPLCARKIRYDNYETRENDTMRPYADTVCAHPATGT